MDARMQQLYQVVIKYRVAATVARTSLAADEIEGAHQTMAELRELLNMHGERQVVHDLHMENVYATLVDKWLRDTAGQPAATTSQDGA